MFNKILAVIVICILGFVLFGIHDRPQQVQAATLAPPPAPVLQPGNKQFDAALEVARVFGRAPGCDSADPKLISQIATEAVNDGIEPRIMAATVAVESSCNQYATSSKGAIGLMQVTPRTWKGTYDFENKYNLLNASDNVHVGGAILSGLIKQYGTANGLRRYNGLGVGCDTCDAGYTDKITSLAARR